MESNKSEQRNPASKDLLRCGQGGGLQDKLLLKKTAATLQTSKVPRSNVLDRLKGFLPEIAKANEELRHQMENSPAGQFDIENVETSRRVIEMDVALVELEGSESDVDGETSDSSDTDSDSDEDTVTEANLKLPGNPHKRKAAIEVLLSKTD